MVASDVASHVCQSEHVTRTGRCEDYPCCGHRFGECADRAEFTSAYWRELRDSMDEDQYDRYCDALDRQEAGY
jgi:hypothetical protein